MNAIHARSQLRYSPTSVDLEIRENPCETAVMLTRPSRDSQEKGTWQAPISLLCSRNSLSKLPSLNVRNQRRFGPALEDERRY